MRKKFDLSLLPPAPDLGFEEELWTGGAGFVAGIDEAGRGCWAGPVAAAAVIFPREPGLVHALNGVRDSKQMSPAERERWSPVIRTRALAWGVGFGSVAEIDALGILAATRLAVQRAIDQLSPRPEHLLVDYLDLPTCACPQTALVKGDARCLSIAAASVLAKTARDELMVQLDQVYPGYGFARHKGYGTQAHQEALARLGPCLLHRRSFAPIRALL